MSGQRAIAPAFVNDALQCVRRNCLDERKLLARVGLPPSVVEPISPEQYGALWRAIADALDDEFFDEGNRPMRVGSFSLLSHAILSTKNLEHALRRMLRFLRVVIDEPYGELVVENGLAQIVLKDSARDRPAFAYRTYWIIVYGLASWLVGRSIPLRQADFRCGPPPRRVHYPLFYGAPIQFNQPTSRLAFDAEYLRLPTIRNERSLRDFLKKAPANILIRSRHDDGIAEKIREILRKAPPATWPTFETLAAEMRVPEPTLRRRLRHEKQTYRDLKDDVRRKLAVQMIMTSRQNIADLAADLGFSEPSAFYRAFRKWTGVTPSTFRHSV